MSLPVSLLGRTLALLGRPLALGMKLNHILFCAGNEGCNGTKWLSELLGKVMRDCGLHCSV